MARRPVTTLHGSDAQMAVDDGVILGYPAGRGDGNGLVLGPGARLRTGTVLYSGSTIGCRFQTGHHVVVREDTTIGRDVSIWSNTVIDYGCAIGDRVKIHANCYVAQYTDIDDDAFLAPGVTCANDLFPGNAVSAHAMHGPFIGKRAQLGVNVTVVPYVSIGAGAIIGAGSVVTKDVPDGVLAYGNPAVVVGEVGDIDIEAQVRRRASAVDERRSLSGAGLGRPDDVHGGPG